MKKEQRIPTLTPCVGRCSTVFGDAVCRGCRRYNHEIIQWNAYTVQQHATIWRRLDAQLDQILIPMLPLANLQHIEQFIVSKRIRLLDSASQGRKLYLALKFCEKNRHLTYESGLGISAQQVKPLWTEFERRILALGQASYDFAWLRADGMRQHYLNLVSTD